MFSTLSAMTSAVAASGALFVGNPPAPPLDLSGSRAGTIQARFDASSLLDPATTAGWFSGRCYKTTEPDTAYGSIAVIETRPVTANNGGPLFDGNTTRVILMGYGTDGRRAIQNPGVFDEISEEDILIFSDIVDSTFANPQFTEAKPYENSLMSHNRPVHTRYEFRKATDYIFARSVDSMDGAVNSYCYFFKQIK